MGALFLTAMLIVGREAGKAGLTGEKWLAVMGNGTAERRCVVLDPGHGGRDPGKVGAGDVLEKDINLQLAMQLKTYLEVNDIEVVMTRTEDIMLEGGSEGETHKMRDMKGRLDVIEEAEPVLVVSIHQNSYPESSVHGAQVFYYEGSAQSAGLAKCLEEAIEEFTAPGTSRPSKSNDNYYLLKKTAVPTVIVESGFLSNPEEAAKLSTPEYRDRMAWAIHMGIVRYLEDSL